jgi:hypothetical protein
MTSRTKYERANDKPILSYNRLSLQIMYKHVQLQSLSQQTADHITNVMRSVCDFIAEVSDYSLHGDIEKLFNALILLYNNLHEKYYG